MPKPSLYIGPTEATLHERANMINSAKAEGREEGKLEGATEKTIRIAQNMLVWGLISTRSPTIS
jgi:hypothetical protein